MKLILKEYISSLKEEKELEGLMVDLLREMKIRVLTVPKKGRQHGVDLLAVGPDPFSEKKSDKLFLFALKQGDIDRQAWNTKVNSVKQTIDEIRDTFITSKLTPSQKKLPKKIILSSNGYIAQAVQDDWTSYVTKYSSADNIEIDSWNIETLIQLIELYLIDQGILPKEDQILLTKTLAFLDTNDYDLRHFEQLCNQILNSKDKRTSKSVRRRLRTINLIQSIVFKWGKDTAGNLRPAVVAAEKAVLKTWYWILENDYTKKKEVLSEFLNILVQKGTIDIHYINKIADHLRVPHALSRYTGMNHAEYSLITWECIGFIASAAVLQLNLLLIHGENGKVADHFGQNYSGMINLLAALISNNPSSHYVYRDDQVIEYTLASFTLKATEAKFLESWSYDILKNLIDSFNIQGRFPQFYASNDDLMKATVTSDKNFVNSSTFLVTMADVFTVLKDNQGYDLLQRACGEKGVFKDINLQSWHPDAESESSFFDSNVLRDFGTTVTTNGLPERIEDYLLEIDAERKAFPAEDSFQTKKLGLFALPLIACRHYRNCVPPNALRDLIEEFKPNSAGP